jgi:hypothetical protein
MGPSHPLCQGHPAATWCWTQGLRGGWVVGWGRGVQAGRKGEGGAVGVLTHTGR